MTGDSKQGSFILRDSLKNMDQESLSIMAHNLKMLIIVIDSEINLIFANDIFFNLVGRSADKVLNRDYVESFIPPDTRLVVRNTLQNIFNKKTPNYSGANKVMTRDKGERLVNWNSIHLHTQNGETNGMLCVGIDVTETHSLNSVLARVGWVKTVLMDHVSELVLYYDAEGRITWANKSFLELFADNMKSVIGSYTTNIFVNHDADLELSMMHQRALLTGQEQELKVQFPDESWWNGLIFGRQSDSMHSRQFVMILSPVRKEEKMIAEVEQDKGVNTFPPIVKQQVGGSEGVVIVSEAMQKIMRQAEILHKDRSVPVLIEGETGVGKEIVARYIHYGDEAVQRPFIDLNCAAITPTIFESELFGYEAGAFTGGLSRGQKGKIALAQEGTLFLDEIGEIPTGIQAKLLRVIQEKEYYRVGGLSKQTADVRWICATNSNLEKRVNEGTFRADLFYRMEAFHLRIPPLRERCDDIIPLAKMFLTSLSRKKNKRFKKINGEAAEILYQYAWPGNVRQLHNFVERVVLLYNDVEVKPEHLSFMFDRKTALEKVENQVVLPPDYFDIEKHTSAIIMQALKKHSGNKTRTAAYLGISRRALTYRLDKIEGPE